ncbi:MAG: hypothetical protein ACRCZO_19125 [Cetobacterium sp.]
MRDTFLGLNQKKVLELKQKYLDGKGESIIKTEDLILIRRIQDFIASSKTVQVVIDREVYSWVKYDVIQEDLPMIFPSLKSFKKRVDRLSNIGLITNKAFRVSKEDISKANEDYFENAGTYSVLRLSRECRTMFDFTNTNSSETKNKAPYPQEGVKGYPQEGVKGYPQEGVKGYPQEGVKGYPQEGVNKEYHDYNTKKEIPKIDTKEESINQESDILDVKKVEFAKNFREYIEKVSKATQLDKFRIEQVVTPSIFRDLEISEILKKIQESKFLKGELEDKPKIGNFTDKRMLNMILLDKYKDGGGRNDKRGKNNGNAEKRKEVGSSDEWW